MFEATGLKVGEDFFLAFSPERVDPGNEKFNTKNTPKVVGGTTPACSQVAAALYAHRDRHDRAGDLDAGRRDGQAAREHLPRRQHRPGQRAGADVRPHGHRRVGSRRRRQDQAVRLHAVLSGPGPRRPLHPDRSVLPVVEGEGEPASRRGSSSWRVRSTPAMPHYVADKVGEALNTQRKAVNGSQMLVARHRLQEGHRRHPRIARARRDARCCRSAAPGRVHRPARAGAARARLAGQHDIDVGRPDARRARASTTASSIADRPQGVRLRGDARRGARWSSTRATRSGHAGSARLPARRAAAGHGRSASRSPAWRVARP